MSYLLDTSVISELSKQIPNEKVIRWLMSVDSDSIWLSVITLLELRVGIESMDEGKRKQRLKVWLEQDIPAEYFGRILQVTEAIADKAGCLIVSAKKFSRLEMDALIAATAMIHDLQVITLDKDFKRFIVPMVEM